MDFFRSYGWLIIAILVLLILLVAVLVVIYDQNGIFLPFASQPDPMPPESVVSLPNKIDHINEIIYIPNWRII